MAKQTTRVSARVAAKTTTKAKPKSKPKPKQVKKTQPIKKAAKVVPKVVAKPKAVVKKPTKPAKVQAPKRVKAVPTKPARAVTTAPKKEKKVPKVPSGFTAAEYDSYKIQLNRLQSFSNQQLKDLLRKNFQTMSGTKDDLVARVADGIVLGRIPRCPHCFGGRPKYDFHKGTYYCAGYRDDTDFKNCHKTMTKEELKRETWEV